MPKIKYINRAFTASSYKLIDQANDIIQDLAGYTLTLRQLYYQFVARGLLDNTTRQYKRLGSLISDARLAGYIDWEAIEDRTRQLEEVKAWENPQDLLDSCALGYALDKWATQPFRVEVWVEKEALAGIFAQACGDFDVPYLSCRGYGSQSLMWAAAQRLHEYMKANQNVLILHFGDHDPSGIDMTRDIRDRLSIFLPEAQRRMEVRRVALNMTQVEEYDPPPNPTKTTDSRATEYISVYGEESWELDALNPATLTQLAQDHIKEVIDQAAWDKVVTTEIQHRKGFRAVADSWDQVLDHLGITLDSPAKPDLLGNLFDNTKGRKP